MAEAETTERAALDAKLADGEVEAAKQGITMAFMLTLIAMTASIVFFALGKVIAGGVLLGLPAATLIGTFITRGKD